MYTSDMGESITFITGNANKADQLSRYLGISVEHQKIDLTEVQSLDLAEVIKHKAEEAYRITQSPVTVDDVSLVIHSMGKLPGPFIKYFISELGNDGICKIASTFQDRSAIAQVCIGYYDGEHHEVCLGTIEGSIADEPRGDGGFGWDAIFIPHGYSQTRAEMSEEDYDATSPRKFALDRLKAYLDELPSRGNRAQ